jgi:hypothetical protein
MRDALRNGESLEPYFHSAVENKPLQHDLVSSVPAGSHLGMSQIGG